MTAAAAVVVVGDVVTDIEVLCRGEVAFGSDTAARISAAGGGSAANAAAWLAWLGVPTELVAVVGTDAAGAERIAELVAAGVGCASVRRTRSAPTGSVVVVASPKERTMLADRGANLLLRRSDVERALSHPVRHLHLSGYTLFEPPARAAGRHALARARELGATTSVDAASAEPIRAIGPARLLSWVRGVDLLLANLDEARALAGNAASAGAAELARRLIAYAKNVVVKDGPRGAAWAHAADTRGVDAHGVEVVTTPALHTDEVDATGAGDAFAAGLLACWLTGTGPADTRPADTGPAGTGPTGSAPAVALAEGTRLGALAVSRRGARPISLGR